MTQSNEPTIELGSSQYRTIHNWLIRHYGKARKCESLKCNKKSKIFQWALRKGLSYQKNKDNYIQLCTSCHHKYDYSENNRKASRVNLAKAQQKRWRPVIKLSTSGGESGRYVSIAAAAKEIGCAPSSISEAISKNTKVRGFKWQYDNQQKQKDELGFDYKSREMETGQPASEEAINRMKERWILEGKRQCPDCGLWFKSEGRCPECNPMG